MLLLTRLALRFGCRWGKARNTLPGGSKAIESPMLHRTTFVVAVLAVPETAEKAGDRQALTTRTVLTVPPPVHRRTRDCGSDNGEHGLVP